MYYQLFNLKITYIMRKEANLLFLDSFLKNVFGWNVDSRLKSLCTDQLYGKTYIQFYSVLKFLTVVTRINHTKFEIDGSLWYIRMSVLQIDFEHCGYNAYHREWPGMRNRLIFSDSDSDSFRFRPILPGCR